MTEDQVKRFNETFPEFANVLGRIAAAWVEAEITESLMNKLKEDHE
jgi:hypothetical protein